MVLCYFFFSFRTAQINIVLLFNQVFHFSLLKVLYLMWGLHSPILMNSRIVMWLFSQRNAGRVARVISRKKLEEPLRCLPCLLPLFHGTGDITQTACPIGLGLDLSWHGVELQPSHAEHKAWVRNKCLFLQGTETWLLTGITQPIWTDTKGHSSIWQRCSWFRRVYPHSWGRKPQNFSPNAGCPVKTRDAPNGTHSGTGRRQHHKGRWALCVSNMNSVSLATWTRQLGGLEVFRMTEKREITCLKHTICQRRCARPLVHFLLWIFWRMDIMSIDSWKTEGSVTQSHPASNQWSWD